MFALRNIVTSVFSRPTRQEILSRIPHERRNDALNAIGAVQRSGGTAAYIDATHALDRESASQCGVAVGELVIAQPECCEDALDICIRLVNSGALRLVVIDSLAAFPPYDELTGEWDDSSSRTEAECLRHDLRKLAKATRRTATRCVFMERRESCKH